MSVGHFFLDKMDEPPIRQPTNELEMLRSQMNKKTDESLASTRNMVKLCDESQKAGATTLETLYTQGEQLRRVDENMDGIHEDLSAAQRDLEEIDKCCGLCVLPWKKKKSHAPPISVANRYAQPSSNTTMGQGRLNGQQRQQPNQELGRRVLPPPTGQYITHITNDAREDEMDQNLHQVSGMVSELHAIALDMNKEINSHNKILERIDQKTDANQSQLAEAQKKADRIVGGPSQPKNETNLMPSDAKWTAAKMFFK